VKPGRPVAQVHVSGAAYQLVSVDAGPGRGDHLGIGIAGTIAAAAASWATGGKMSFSRPRAKDHGLRALVEGAVSESALPAALTWAAGSAPGRFRFNPAAPVLVAGRELSGAAPLVAGLVRGERRPGEDDGDLRGYLDEHRGTFVTAAGRAVDRYFDIIPALCDPARLRRLAAVLAPYADGCGCVAAAAFGGIPLAVSIAIEAGLPCYVVDPVIVRSAGVAASVPAGRPPGNALLVDDFTSVGSTFGLCIGLLEAWGCGVRRLATGAALAPGVRVGGHLVHSAVNVYETTRRA